MRQNLHDQVRTEQPPAGARSGSWEAVHMSRVREQLCQEIPARPASTRAPFGPE